LILSINKYQLINSITFEFIKYLKMNKLLYLIMAVMALSCGNSTNQKGLNIPQEGLTFEMDEEDSYTFDGYRNDATMDLGKLNQGEGTVQIKSGSTLSASGVISESKPFTFTHDSVGYRLVMQKFNYNLITASTAIFKIEPFEILSPEAIKDYHNSKPFEDAVREKFQVGQSFELIQRQGRSMDVGKSILYFKIGDITQGRTNISINLGEELIVSQNISPLQSFAFKLGNVDLILSCDKFIDDLLDQGFFSIRVASEDDLKTLNERREEDPASAISGSSVVQSSESTIPKDGASFMIYQRNSKVFIGKKSNLTILIGDITDGQTAMTVIDGSKEISSKSMTNGQSISFTFEKKKYTLTCERLVNHAMGNDEGYFRIDPVK
jgi:hypothetical protein